ncbi:MAG: ABC transporter ATP-binding protein [Pseudomonadota bacterium]
MHPDPATPRLQIHDLRRSYAGRCVVDGVSLSISAGQVTCLLGPSGCGKSTTLRMIAGVEAPESGRIAVDGKLQFGEGINVPPERRGIGLMFQDFALFPHLTVADNVAFGLSGRRQPKRARVADLLARVTLSDLSGAYPHQLSGGEQQRVALARALAPQPRIMLMDEPFSGLDNRLRDAVRDDMLAILKEEGTAVLLVTHDPGEAMRMADEIALMRAGRIVQQGPPYKIYAEPLDQGALRFFSDANALRGKITDGQVPSIFGPFPAPDLPEGSAVDVLFRPQHVQIDFDRAGAGPRPSAARGTAVRATVTRARFLGIESLIEFRVNGETTPVTATVPEVFLPPPGTPFWLAVPRNRCFVFPAGALS